MTLLKKFKIVSEEMAVIAINFQKTAFAIYISIEILRRLFWDVEIRWVDISTHLVFYSDFK